MTAETNTPRGSEGLLGLRSPTVIPSEPAAPPARPKAPPPPKKLPPRPSYPVVSSGWDSEETENRGKTSDLGTALRAGGVLVAIVVALGLLLR